MATRVQVQTTVSAVASKSNKFALFSFIFSLTFSFFSSAPVESFDGLLCPTDLTDNYQMIFSHVDSFTVCQGSNTHSDPTKWPYRKYIEHVLKSRGLGQALSFLHHLHNVVLRKAHATLELPGAEDDSDLDFEGFNGHLSHTEVQLSKEEEEDLHRYGVWSEEAISLNLPSYVPAFVFLSVLPLEVMHEYLRMRLETKPVTPNPLSLEQLMKELREGLILAMTHRERYSKHIHTAFTDKETELEKYTTILDNYDATVKKVLNVSSDVNAKQKRKEINFCFLFFFYSCTWSTSNNGYR